MTPIKRGSDSKNGDNSKRPRNAISLQKKMDILKRLAEGEQAATISRVMGIPATTIRTIKQNEVKIRSSATESTTRSLEVTTKIRPHTLEKMEKLLLLWIEDLNQKNVPLSKAIIQNKAKSIYEDIKQIYENEENMSFDASSGWFEKFKKRTKLHSIKMTGEAASADKEAAENFPKILQNIITEGGYSPKQIFNVDETGLIWKRMVSRTYLLPEKTAVPGFKVSKERLTLLLVGNAAGDFKLKPLVIYKSQNPRALKNIPKENLPVIWKSNAKAWVTANIFSEWFNLYFCPKVKEYCRKNNLAEKALLIIDNAPGHPVNLDETSGDIKVIFLPPNTTALLQPMDQGVIATFKAYYLRLTLKKLIEQIDRGDDNTVQRFWKEFTILDALNNIKKSWDEVKESNMKGVWKKLLPEVETDCENDELEEIRREIMGMGVDSYFSENDVEEFLISNEEPLSTEELLECLRDQENPDNARSSPSEVDEQRCLLTLEKMSEAFNFFDRAVNIFESCDPDKERFRLLCEGVNNSLRVYKELYKEKQRTSLIQPQIRRYFQPCSSTQLQNSTVETETDEEIVLTSD